MPNIRNKLYEKVSMLENVSIEKKNCHVMPVHKRSTYQWSVYPEKPKISCKDYKPMSLNCIFSLKRYLKKQTFHAASYFLKKLERIGIYDSLYVFENLRIT